MFEELNKLNQPLKLDVDRDQINLFVGLKQTTLIDVFEKNNSIRPTSILKCYKNI